MPNLDDLLAEYEAACRAEESAINEGRLSPSIIARRDAATRNLHAAEDPWMPCICAICSGLGD